MIRHIVILASLAGAVALGGCAAGPTDAGTDEHRPHDATMSHRFDDVQHWVERFDDPARDAWQRPADVVAFLELAPGATAADIGAGTGYFAVHLARAVGAEGRVLAVDIEPGLVEYMQERATRESVPWIEPVLTEPDEPGVPAGTADVVLIVNTWHHIDDRLTYLDKLADTLKPGGRVVVVDFHEGELPVGPPAGHKLSQEHVQAEFDEAGWTLAASYDDLPYQYVLAFVR